MEFILVRIEDLPAITDAARLGDQVSAELSRAIRAFDAGNIAIGVCEECSALSDRRLRRRIERYNI
jgi:hypothetical protein